ncbi:unnamed protein product (macronuclear) [Paramecium tetraurelia]|uniref:Transmembrane protein n=1 Tax=Paramecium tetraurelia TaxID=5888 RepID=A0CFW3_PARTE|nr:uncharacterized protein GSPATT00038122001 [Paramecium tetraurelia]CAK69680.1 unnamed protein product [Paramecium tetraurelia]|eukprot:XP_001437077.1 hypothetical protein (macronuclear) [Paramecium tetraurelia strain d4-2]
MELIINQISLFVQGALILEQFIWSLPLMISFALGVINELQNLAYINISYSYKAFSTTSELDLITILSRPNTLIENTAILAYISVGFLFILVLSCICFIFILKSRSENLVIELQNAFNTNYYFKVLFIFVNVSINISKQTFGYIMMDICFQTIQQNINDYLKVFLSFLTIAGIFIIILFFVNMFSYNWALDFQREHLMINESNLTYYRIGIKFLQLSFSLYIYDDIPFRLTQLILPIISSIIQIYQMQKLKQYIYGSYYRVILAINLINIAICLQYLLHELFQQHQFKEIWVLVIILPFFYFQNQIKIDLQKHFINYQNSSIENCNFVLFQIIYNITKQKNTYKQKIVYLMFLSKHIKACYDIDCTCKQSPLEKNFQQISYEIYFKDLLSQYESLISTMSFKCTQDQQIFAYLQLLFFQKQYLQVYQCFQIIFQKSDRTKFQNQILMTDNYKMKKKVFKINYLHKLIVLKVAQDLMRLDIAQQFSNQKNTLLNESQKIHYAIKAYLDVEGQCVQIRKIISQVVQQKINYLEKINSNISKEQLEKLAYKSIKYQIDGLKQLKSFFKQTLDQKQQNILMFYQMEILNDMISSQNQKSSSNYNDETNLKFSNAFLSNQFSNMIIQINNKQSIKILKYKYNKLEKFDKLETLNFQDMIPNYIQVSHMKLIQNFIAGRQNKFYQQLNESYIQISPCLCKKIDLLMDLSQLNLTSIEMIVFFKKIKESSYSIFLDDTKRILNIDDELFCDVLQFDGVFAQYFIGLDICTIYKHIDQLIQDKFYSLQTFYFVDPNKVNASFFMQSSQVKIQQQWNYHQSLICYQCDLSISQKRNEYGSSYYELIIKNPKRVYNNGDTQSENVIATTHLDESIIVDKPFAMEQSIHEEKIYNQQCILKSEFVCQNLMQSDIQQDEQLVAMKNEEEQHVSEELDMNTQKKKKLNQKLQTEGISSQQSGVSAMQKSIYYRQFSLVYELTNSRKIPQIFKKMIYFRILLTIISIVGFGLTQYLYEIDLFHHFQKDFKLLGMKNDIFYPILSFQLIRLSIVNYNVEFYYKIITQQQYLEFLVYPKSRLIGSYEKLKNGISGILTEPIFFTLYQDQYLNLEFLQKGNVGETSMLSFRNSLMTLLNYQYDTQNAYIQNGQADYESSYFYYNYKNLHTLLNAFTDANLVAFDAQQQHLDDSQQKIIVIFIVLCFFFVMIQFTLTVSDLVFQIQKEKLKILLLNQDQNFLNLEIQRLTLLQELIEKNYQQIQNYKLNFQEKDEYFGMIKQQCSHHSKHQQKKNTISPEYYKLKSILLTLTHFGVLAVSFIVLTTQIYHTYSKIKQTGRLYEVFANLNINVLSIYQTREILYYKSAFPFLNQTDLNQYYKIAQEGLVGLEQYTDQQWTFQPNDYFFDSEFSSLLDSFSNGNLCVELVVIQFKQSQAIDNSYNICNTTLGGVLQKGISTALIDIKNQIKTEFEYTNFTNRSNFPILELEGITILSYGLQYILERFYSDLFYYNQQVEVDYNIITVACLCISIINGLLLIKFDQIIQLRNYKLLTKFIYSVPLAAILYDDNFLRNTRSYFVNEKLI